MEELTEEQVLLQQQFDTALYLCRKAREKYMIDLYRQKLVLQCQQGTAPPQVQLIFDQVKEERQKSLNPLTETYGYFVCCNPNNGVSIDELLKAGKKAQGKVWIDSYCWVVEQRGATLEDMGKGIHYHGLITAKCGKKHGHIVRELANTFKHLTDTSNYQWFSVKPVVLEEYKRKLKYIAGYKNDEEKIIKQRIDVKYRHHMNIPKTFNSQDFDFMGMYEEVE